MKNNITTQGYFVKRFRDSGFAVVKLFEGQKYMGGHVDGKMTLNENLADLGGMAIALDALNTILPADPEERKKAYVDFFTGFAVSWRGGPANSHPLTGMSGCSQWVNFQCVCVCVCVCVRARARVHARMRVEGVRGWGAFSKLEAG